MSCTRLRHSLLGMMLFSISKGSGYTSAVSNKGSPKQTKVFSKRCLV